MERVERVVGLLGAYLDMTVIMPENAISIEPVRAICLREGVDFCLRPPDRMDSLSWKNWGT